MNRKPLDFGEVNTMNCEQFDQWWDGKDPDSTANPYRKDTPAFWAWAGWKAGVLAERERCIKIIATLYGRDQVDHCDIIETIREGDDQ